MRWLSLFLLLAGCSTAEEPEAPRPHPQVSGTALDRNAACEGCHADIASEWRASLHQQANSDPFYQRSFSREPLDFCTSCHAPEADAKAPEPALAALGTACVTCHANEKSVTETRSCEGCHEFPFPDGKGKMQLTVTEHGVSAHADKTCASCHMPRKAGHASHFFAASRDPETLRSAARITAARTPDGVLLTFSPDAVGHAFPTGDIFRRLRVEVQVPGDATTLRRVFLDRNTKTGGPDTRPFVTGTPAEVRIPIEAPASPLAWSVHYDRVEYLLSPDGSDAVVEGSVDIASGTLAP